MTDSIFFLLFEFKSLWIISIIPSGISGEQVAFKIGALIESYDSESWPPYSVEILELAKSNILRDQEIDLSLTYIETKCNTKLGLISTTLKVVQPDQKDIKE